MSALVAIHQPNFFPWLGYFDKIRRADIFIFLDCVDYPRAGSGSMGSWTNRVRIDIQGTARWITCPVRRMPLGAPISAARIDDAQGWREKMRKTLAASYGRAPGYLNCMKFLNRHLERTEDCLAEFNIRAIMDLASELGLSTRFIRQSEIPQTGKGTELLISLVRGVGGRAYLAGAGASDYQLDALFEEHGIELLYQRFQQKPYGDPRQFMPGLSVIDFLMRTAPEEWSAL